MLELFKASELKLAGGIWGLGWFFFFFDCLFGFGKGVHHISGT